MAHIRVETRAATQEGSPTISNSDRVVVVTDDGERVDISSVVRGYGIIAEVGEMRRLTLDVLKFHVVEMPKEDRGQWQRGDVTTVADHARIFENVEA